MNNQTVTITRRVVTVSLKLELCILLGKYEKLESRIKNNDVGWPME